MHGRVAVLLSLALAVAPAMVMAQGNADILIDLDRDWSAARQADPAGLTPLQLGALTTTQLKLLGSNQACKEPLLCGEADITLPLTFNSNPLGAAHQTEDGHGRPDLTLVGALKFDRVTGVVSVDTAVDRYIGKSAANVDLLKFWAGVSIALSESSSVTSSAYLGYRPTLTFSEDFGDLRRTFHDLLGGSRVVYRFGAPQNSTSKPYSLAADLNLGHRTANPTKASAFLTQVSVSLSYAYYDRNNVSRAIWGMSVKPSLNTSWYDNEESGKARHDVRLGASLTFKWYPWHGSVNDVLGATYLTVQTSVSRNESNIRSHSFTVWDVGPSFNLVFGRVPPSAIRPLVPEPPRSRQP